MIDGVWEFRSHHSSYCSNSPEGRELVAAGFFNLFELRTPLVRNNLCGTGRYGNASMGCDLYSRFGLESLSSSWWGFHLPNQGKVSKSDFISSCFRSYWSEGAVLTSNLSIFCKNGWTLRLASCICHGSSESFNSFWAIWGDTCSNAASSRSTTRMDRSLPSPWSSSLSGGVWH